MNISTMAGIRIAAIAASFFVASAHAATIIGGVDTNFCSGNLMSDTLGSYSGSCSLGDSSFTWSGDAEGSGVTFGDTISATDSSINNNVSGNSASAFTQYQNQVTLSSTGYVTLTFNVQGTTTNINGDYAQYSIDAELENQAAGYFFAPPATGTGSGAVTMTTQDPLNPGSYRLTILTAAQVCFWGCTETVSEAGSKNGEMASDTANFLDTFQLIGVTDSGGGTVIGADGTNFTDLGAVPEPRSAAFVLLGIFAAAMLWRRRRAA